MGDNESKGLGSQSNTFQIVDYSTKLKVFPGGSVGKESAWNAGDLGLTPGLRRSPGDGTGYPLQSSGLENSMNCVDHGVAKSQIQLSDFHFHFKTWKESSVQSLSCV